jgi:trehalose 6-phosphate synthase
MDEQIVRNWIGPEKQEMTLIVVSNRVACPAADEPIEGGLAAALLPAVQTCGAIWVGANQCAQDSVARESFAKIESYGTGTIATVDFPRREYRGFYEGFSNSALWPALHSRPDLIRTSSEDYWQLSRHQRTDGARVAALCQAGRHFLDS